MGRKPLFFLLLAASGALNAAPALADNRAGVEAWTREDYAGAVKQWEAAAARGDADAMFNLAQAYKLGKGVPRDLVKAEDLFGRAAALGHPQAADNYGLLLFQRGEKARALPFIRAAADRGDPRSQYLLGLAHFNGDLVTKDWPRAYALVSLAREQGLPQAADAMVQMDQYIPLEQRREGVALASELRAQADATRARQLAATDLGGQVVAPGTGPATPRPAAPRPAPVAQPSSPATAGADYTVPRTPVATPVPPKPRPAAPAVVTAPAPAPKPPVATAPPATAGKWRIQLGAFGVASNADALWARVRSRPELAGHPRLNVKAGAVTKLQAGGYTEEGARAACGKLRAAGFECSVVAG